MPPAEASTRFSTTSCRSTRPRPAPMAARTATSLRRADARASCRLAMFTHAIVRTTSTQPNRINNERRACPMSTSVNGVTRSRGADASFG